MSFGLFVVAMSAYFDSKEALFTVQRYAIISNPQKKRAANLSVAALFMSHDSDFAYFTLSQRLEVASVRKKANKTLLLLLLIRNFGNDSLESLGVVQGEVGEHLAVDLDTSL